MVITDARRSVDVCIMETRRTTTALATVATTARMTTSLAGTGVTLRKVLEVMARTSPAGIMTTTGPAGTAMTRMKADRAAMVKTAV